MSHRIPMSSAPVGRVDQRLLPRGVALGARQAPRARPTPVAVHHAGHVRGHARCGRGPRGPGRRCRAGVRHRHVEPTAPALSPRAGMILECRRIRTRGPSTCAAARRARVRPARRATTTAVTPPSRRRHGGAGQRRAAPRAAGDGRAVGEAIVTGTHLVVEAGTGIGKSLAYLVPAALSGARWSWPPPPRPCRTS